MTAPHFELIEPQVRHCGPMARRLRKEHRAASEAMGESVHRQIRNSFDQSSYRRALLCDGRMIAMGGVIGSLLSATGFIWLACVEDIDKHPKMILRVVRGLLADVMTVKRDLVSVVLHGDKAALRFVQRLGFRVSQDQPYAIGLVIEYSAGD